MTFNNAVNSSNIHFQNTSGTLEVADRLRVSTTGSTFNLGIMLAAGTFSVTGANGTALSATNPAYVILQDRSSPGLNKIFTVTANQTFIDDAGASTIIGNLFGLTTSIAYAQDLPFFLYAVSNDAEDTILFAISRVPHRTVAPAAGSFGKTGSAIADTQGSFFALGDPTIADYDSNPCTCIGSFRMRMSAADDWTVQALAASDGIGEFNDGTEFSIATGQFGAAAGSFFLNNGGTAPAFVDQASSFHIDKGGKLRIVFNSGAATAGAGAVQMQFATPFALLTAGNVGYMIYAGTSAIGVAFSPSASRISWTYVDAGSAGSLNNSAFAGGQNFQFGLDYISSTA